MADLRQHDEFWATFQPTKVDDLKTSAAQHVGERHRWCAAWEIESGRYAGQWACTTTEMVEPPIGWVPLCDLVDIERAHSDE